jgi:N-acetyl-anhydromuramyl-L-alanine amidase AmpD
MQKRQIVISHTASGENLPPETYIERHGINISGCYVIFRDGTIVQTFVDDLLWTWHLSIAPKDKLRYNRDNRNLDAESISVELVNWGPVLPDAKLKFYPIKYSKQGKGGKIWRYPDTSYNEVTPDEYCGNGFRSHRYHEMYPTKQVNALRELLVFLSKKHNIPLRNSDSTIAHDGVALSGESGLYSLTEFREDVEGIHPSAGMVNMLSGLKNIV